MFICADNFADARREETGKDHTVGVHCMFLLVDPAKHLRGLSTGARINHTSDRVGTLDV